MPAETFSASVAIAGAAILLAVLSQRLSARIRVPAPAFFLIAAALVAELLPRVTREGQLLDERIVSVALVFILFDGGMRIGWRRARASAGAITWLGVAGTAVTAAAIVLVAHLLIGLDWRMSLLLGAALSPTDPAVVFSVLGRREVSGRVGTILEGESGANDPVGISIMASLLVAGGTGWHAFGQGSLVFVIQLAVGGAVGVLGGWGLRALLRRVPLPNEALASVITIAAAAVLYGAGSVAFGSGYLSVFVAGILVGDIQAPYKSDIMRFTSGISSLAEIVAFVVLGLTIRLDVVMRPEVLIAGFVLSGLLIFVIRPVLVGALSLPIRLNWGERGFLCWAGLKGAVPILLGLTVVSSGVDGGQELYAVIFVVVLVSVLLQGSLVPALARVFRVPMREVASHPYGLDIRFAGPPVDLYHFSVAPGSPADGARVDELLKSQDAWVSLASRHGHQISLRPETTLQAGDVVTVHAGDDAALTRVFSGER